MTAELIAGKESGERLIEIDGQLISISPNRQREGGPLRCIITTLEELIETDIDVSDDELAEIAKRLRKPTRRPSRV